VFKKARRKAREVRFFLAHLQRDGLPPEEVEFYWHALLNGGKTATFALRAEVGKKAYGPVFSTWHNSLDPANRDLFDLLHGVRDVEVHEKGGPEVLSKMEARSEWRQWPSDPTTMAVYANYLAMGMLEPVVTVSVATYQFQINETKTKEVKELFGRVAAGGAISITDACSQYADLLESLIDTFVKAFPMPSGAGGAGTLGRIDA